MHIFLNMSDMLAAHVGVITHCSVNSEILWCAHFREMCLLVGMLLFIFYPFLSDGCYTTWYSVHLNGRFINVWLHVSSKGILSSPFLERNWVEWFLLENVSLWKVPNYNYPENTGAWFLWSFIWRVYSRYLHSGTHTHTHVHSSLSLPLHMEEHQVSPSEYSKIP